MLSNQQIETFIYAYRQQLEALKAQQTSINSAITQLQNNLSDLEAASSGTSSTSNVNVLTDSYVVGDSVLHRLKHLFQAAVTFVSDVAIQGVLTLSNALGVASGGTGSTTATGARTNLSAAKSGANSDITSLTGLTTPLPISEGGTGETSGSLAILNLGGVLSGVFPGGATVSLAKLTVAGTNGSLTVNDNGDITAYTPPT